MRKVPLLRLVKIVITSLMLSLFMPIANADTDPFPGVAIGAEIPGTRISSAAGQSQAAWEATDAYKNRAACPAGSGNGIEVNATTHVYSIYCVKTWRSTETIDAEAKYRADLAAAQAVALAQSQAWNAANPGQQKCFQWGPITSPSGGTSSGGVCANPVSVAPPSSGSNSETTTASSSGSSGSSSPTSSNSSTSTSSSDTRTASIPPSTGVAQVVDVPGQGDCPGGNDGWRRNLEVNATTGRTVTHCVRIETIVISTGANTTTTVTRVVGSDPYPNLATGAEIPGTKTWSTNETSWAQFATNSMRSGWACPIIYGPNGDPYAAENNGFDNAAGKWFRVCVKNPWREASPTITSTASGSDSRTVTTATDTRTATSSSDTRTATSRSDTRTISAVAPSTLNETRTAAVAVISTVTNTENKAVLAGELLKTYSAVEKESLLNVTLKSTKAAIININTDIPQVNMVLTAVKKNAPALTYKVVTDNNGDAKISTSKNLAGYTVTLIAGNIKLDSDLVKK